MLTAEQKAHWDTFGFLMLRQMFSPDEMRTIREAVTDVIQRDRGGDALRGKERWSSGGFLEGHPFLTSLLDDD